MRITARSGLRGAPCEGCDGSREAMDGRARFLYMLYHKDDRRGAMATRVHDRMQPIKDLNTTPLIDVLLVLLVMFIITVPLQTHKVAIDLPQADPAPRVELDPVRNRVTIDAAGTIRWNGGAVDRTGLRGLLARSKALPAEPALDLVPDADARYMVVDGVLADIKRAGVTKLGLPGNEAYQAF